LRFALRSVLIEGLREMSQLRTIIEDAVEEHDLSLKELTVLSAQVDPYRLDTPRHHRDGKWLAEQFNLLFGSAEHIHLRGLYYAIVAAGNIRKPDGEIFVGTLENWEWLGGAGKAARWLGYIPFDRVTDNRNSAPIIHRKEKVEPEKFLGVRLHIDIPDARNINPTPIVYGFDVRQAFHFVIFGEKSSLEDVVLPIAREYEADLFLPTGEISDTLIYQIAKDANEDGRPLVLFTLSDCDPAGWQMPVSIARKLQAFKDLFFPDLKFEIVPALLTPEQARAENLPESPLKDGEKRASRWKEAFGCEQTEIDALTIPSKVSILRRYLWEAFAPYIDDTLWNRVREARNDWFAKASAAIQEQINPDHIEEIREQAADKLGELREEIDRLNNALTVTCGAIELPDIEVPESEINIDVLDDVRQALVSFDCDWVEATQALIRRKSYGDAP
jgi:hypothetical protein